jgi:hypothetical protein
MNELIREVAKEAGLQPFEDCGPGYVYKMEKFAELIVKKCMTIGFNTVYKVDDDSAAVAVYQNIKEHFGVEE